ncbi:histidine kinase dimerization/phospho-acceptor domain-containing protein [Bifidobacterium callitrichos]|uniref:histidine kinase dimerization/phospho-acceptor domain-containing protein n=1 Tax=Bifidobacterium callitrichos TaxID=762209 RepID=UPI002158BBA4|nr:histidine kinase dimerization/phospho-acceptor domain-containing protein [Bifidobacterium callitrichos]
MRTNDLTDEEEASDRPSRWSERSRASRGLSGWIVLWSFVALVLAAAGQTTLTVFLPRLFPILDRGVWSYLMAVIVILCWLLLAFAFAWFTGRQIDDRLERPMRTLGRAAARVAKGDFSVYVTPRHVEGGRGWDSTDQMFADFNTMVEELGGIETMRNDFVSNVSHEIRNPLAVIRNYATLLERSNTLDEPRRRDAAHTIVEASTRLQHTGDQHPQTQQA